MEVKVLTRMRTDCFLVAKQGVLFILFSQPISNEQYINVAQTANSNIK